MVSRVAWVVVLLGLLCFQIACPGSESSRATGLIEIPTVGAERILEPQVLEQFVQAQQTLEKAWTGSDATLAKAYAELGRLHQAYGNGQIARDCYQNAWNLQPDEVQWLYALGWMEDHLGNLEQGGKLLAQVVPYRPRDVPARVRLGLNCLARNEPQQAEEHLEKALELKPDCAMALWGLGQVALSRKDATTALRLFGKANRLQPDSVELLSAMARAYQQQGQARAAQEMLQRIPREMAEQFLLELEDPWIQQIEKLNQSSKAWSEEGHAAFAAGQYALAVRAFEKSLEGGGNSSLTLYNLALAQLRIGQVETALGNLQLACEASSGHLEACLLLGNQLELFGKKEAAESILRKALQQDPNSGRASFVLGDLLRRNRRYEEALELYQQGLQKNPSAGAGHMGQALCLLLLGRHQAAWEFLENSVQGLKSAEPLQLLQIRILSASSVPELRNGQEALRRIQQKSFSPSIAVLETQAMVFAELQDFARAQKLQSQALDVLERQELSRIAALERQALYRVQLPCRQPWHSEEPTQVVLSLPN